MRKKIKLSVGPGIEVEEIILRDGRWVLSARAAGERSCPVCGDVSTSRHDWHRRRLQDLPVQGTPLVLDLRLGRWRCLNERCNRKTFVERLPSVAAPMARRTVRVAEIVRLFGHAAGGLPSERLLARLAMPISDNAILRQLKRHVRERADSAPLRVIAIDDWSWRKGFTYGTIIVDLERRTVADVLETRSAKETANWLARRPEIEIVSRDRCGLYAQGIRQGAPQARQVADRFHLLQNLREAIERQMTAVSCFGGRSRLPPAPGDLQLVLRRRNRDAREQMFGQAKALHASGKSCVAIAAEIGIGRGTIAKWVEADSLPDRRRVTLKPSSPLYFQEFLARRWAEGDKIGRRLFHDVRHRGYKGSRSHLERLLSEWRRVERPETSGRREPTIESRAIDPATGWQISPVVAAALCMKPTRMLTHSQAAKVAVLKEASPSFVVMRGLAMRFRGLLRGADPDKLGSWLDDASHSGIHALQQFARILARDIDAVRNAIAEPWSSGQAEGQINRLKTLKRAMFGRAGIELLRARMLPLQ
jgi:transposase